MTRTFLFLIIISSALSFTSCSKDGDNTKLGETKEVYINATSTTAWNYYSFSKNSVVGTAEESEINNSVWAARKDWDIAIRHYIVRTNSGKSTTAGAKGGVLTYDANTSYSSVLNVPSNAQFTTDKSITFNDMNGTITLVRSDATVILFKKNEDGSTAMPPVYLPAPVYIFRTANGKNYYKVQFTQYMNESNVTGHVKFNMARIN